jgi:hypothetical protein
MAAKITSHGAIGTHDTNSRIWFLHGSHVERIKVEEANKKAQPWDGELPDKNALIWGKLGIGKG